MKGGYKVKWLLNENELSCAIYSLISPLHLTLPCSYRKTKDVAGTTLLFQ